MVIIDFSLHNLHSFVLLGRYVSSRQQWCKSTILASCNESIHWWRPYLASHLRPDVYCVCLQYVYFSKFGISSLLCLQWVLQCEGGGDRVEGGWVNINMWRDGSSRYSREKTSKHHSRSSSTLCTLMCRLWYLLIEMLMLICATVVIRYIYIFIHRSLSFHDAQCPQCAQCSDRWGGKPHLSSANLSPPASPQPSPAPAAPIKCRTYCVPG